jgi:hypothetical protein
MVPAVVDVGVGREKISLRGREMILFSKHDAMALSHTLGQQWQHG